MKKMMLGSAIVMLACLFFACDKLLIDDHKKFFDKDHKPERDCKNVKYYKQDDLGAPPSHNNTGAYLHRKFKKVFSHGLTVGCYPDKYYVKLTSAEAVTNLLPCYGYAEVLSAKYTDPHSIKNVLVGLLIALKISVEFDKHDNYGKSSVLLGDMIIKHGIFKDCKVFNFLVIAEKVIGGCKKDYTIHQVYETAKLINEHFDDKGRKDFLKCPRKFDVCKCDDKKDYDKKDDDKKDYDKKDYDKKDDDRKKNDKKDNY